jgi:hypothetical protein
MAASRRRFGSVESLTVRTPDPVLFSILPEDDLLRELKKTFLREP